MHLNSFVGWLRTHFPGLLVGMGLGGTLVILIVICSPKRAYEFHPHNAGLYRCNPTTGEVDFTSPMIGHWRRVPEQLQLDVVPVAKSK